jgi:hypothetical protein
MGKRNKLFPNGEQNIEYSINIFIITNDFLYFLEKKGEKDYCITILVFLITGIYFQIGGFG